MKHIYHDGGRVTAGYKGRTGDCTTRAIAIAAGLPYQEVYDTINTLGRADRNRRGGPHGARTGVSKVTIRRYLASIGWAWVPTMHIGSGCRVHLADGELPTGRLIVSLSRHLCAVIDNVIYDTYDPQRGSSRCVYGYWSKP